MTSCLFETDCDSADWKPRNLQADVERALRRGRHVLFTGRVGSGRTRAARLARSLLADTGEATTVIHLDAPTAVNTDGRCLYVGAPSVNCADLPDPRNTTMVTVHPWDQDEVRGLLAKHGLDAGIADRLYAATGGHLSFLRAWDDAGRPTDLTGAEPWQATVDRALDLLAANARALVEELACGFGVLTAPLAPSLTAAGSTDPAHLLDSLDEGALLGPGGELVPAAVDAIARRLAPYRRQWLRCRFLADLRDPLPRQELLLNWAQSGLDDPRLTSHLATCAEHLRLTDPRQALHVHSVADAEHAGPDALAGLAEAALLTGDTRLALRSGEPLLAGGPGPTRSRALRVVERVWLGKGLARRAAVLDRKYATPDTLIEAAASFLAQVRVGDLAAADEAWSRRPAGVATVTDEIAAVSVVEAVRISVTTGVAAPTSVERLCELGLSVSPECRLATDWTGVVGALALQSGHAPFAQTMLHQLADHADFSTEHRLLLGWANLETGRLSEAAHCLARGRPRALAPREEVLAAGLAVGLAQRGNDRAALALAWPTLVAATARCEPDLFGLTAYPEMFVAAARLREGRALTAVWSHAHELLAALGYPPLWSNRIDWAEIQAAFLINEPDRIKEPAKRLSDAAPRSAQAEVLARAGRVWVEVLSQAFDPEEVLAAAKDVVGISLGHDAARLAAHAAARCNDPVFRRDLLDAARQHSTESRVDRAQTADPMALQLSDREIQVALMVVRHRSYREIGETLFLSPRTVENHIARIKRRSGARNRRELLDQLQQTLKDLGRLG